MTIAFWCILVASLLPIGFAGLAKSRMKLAENAFPRDYKNTLDGWRKRAFWAESNSYESFPTFAAAVLVCHAAQGPQDLADLLAVGYIVCRLAYGFCYLIDQAIIRSLFWMGGLGCTVGLYLICVFSF